MLTSERMHPHRNSLSQNASLPLPLSIHWDWWRSPRLSHWVVMSPCRRPVQLKVLSEGQQRTLDCSHEAIHQWWLRRCPKRRSSSQSVYLDPGSDRSRGPAVHKLYYNLAVTNTNTWKQSSFKNFNPCVFSITFVIKTRLHQSVFLCINAFTSISRVTSFGWLCIAL